MARQGEPREPTVENIRRFWEGEAAGLGNTPEATIRDLFFRLHEIETLVPLVPEQSSLLDAGCGNGFGTLLLAPRARRVVAVDCSEGMLGWARRLQDDAEHRRRLSAQHARLRPLAAPRPENVEFRLADVTQLDLGPERFEVVTTQRLLINLPSRELQRRALARLREHAAPGAVLLMAETTLQGYARSDAFRARVGLGALERHWHNLYLDEDDLPGWQTLGWRADAVIGFETYLFLSKVVYPAACGSDNVRFLSGANAAAMEVAAAFRTYGSAAEIGERALLDLWVDRVRRKDEKEGAALGTWLRRHGRELGDWSGMGHQRLVLGRAV